METTVIIPTLNEEKNIGILIDWIKKLYPKMKIIVSDDGSVDDTQKIARRKGVLVLDRSKKQIKGLTISVLEGLDEVNTKYFLVIDGDLQHPPEKIGEIMKKLEKGYDFVIGSRIKIESDWPILRRLMSFIASFLGNLRLFIGKFRFYPDVLSGFFGAKTELFRNLPRDKFYFEGYKVLFDGLKLVNRNAKVARVYYTFGSRKGGMSKIKMKHIRIFLRSLFS